MTVLEFDVDDMTGEEIAVAADRLRTEPGVVDVSVGTRQARRDGRSPISGCWCNRTRPTRSRGPASPKRRRWDCAGARSAGACCAGPSVIATVDGATVSAKVAMRPGGERTAKAAQDNVVATPGLGERRRVRAMPSGRVLKDGEK